MNEQSGALSRQGSQGVGDRRLGVVMHGVTGRMGMNQHLIRSVLAIRDAGGVALSDGSRVVPDPLIVGRSEAKIARLAAEHGVERWTTDLDAALAGDDAVFFDAGTTRMRAGLLERAIRAGKHVYCEKPIADDVDAALEGRPPRPRGRRQERRGSGQALPAGAAQAQAPDRRGLLRAHPVACAASSATGCSRATGCPPSARPGTTARRRAGASSSTCCATGATCSTPSSAPCARCRAPAPPTSPSAGTSAASATRPTPTTRPTRPLSSRAG